MTSPRPLSSLSVTYGNTQRRKNCSLPKKEVPLKGKKKKNSNSGARKVGKSEKEKDKKDKKKSGLRAVLRPGAPTTPKPEGAVQLAQRWASR